MQTFHGSCLCQKNRFSFEVDHPHADICHCGTCRQWTGGPLMTIMLLDQESKRVEDKIKFSAGPVLGSYQSSGWARRQFCQNCGTTLFWKDLTGTFCSINLYTIEGAEKLKINTQIFIDDKPDHYSFAGDIPAMTGKEVFAKFAE